MLSRFTRVATSAWAMMPHKPARLVDDRHPPHLPVRHQIHGFLDVVVLAAALEGSRSSPRAPWRRSTAAPAGEHVHHEIAIGHDPDELAVLRESTTGIDPTSSLFISMATWVTESPARSTPAHASSLHCISAFQLPSWLGSRLAITAVRCNPKAGLPLGVTLSGPVNSLVFVGPEGVALRLCQVLRQSSRIDSCQVRKRRHMGGTGMPAAMASATVRRQPPGCAPSSRDR